MSVRGEIKYEWTCDFKNCSNQHMEKWEFIHGDIIPVACLPEGWLEVKLGPTLRFCETHHPIVQDGIDYVLSLVSKE